ncbi:MAG: double-strand break repair helicase AddA [Hyphomicrobiaceae bacterium]
MSTPGMSTPVTTDDIEAITEQTNRRQARAADPATSAWVSANAGTGKTHVLTRRVLRLLLAGTAPERILCLTYTKAAAAEMSTRVFAELGFWVTKPADELRAGLVKLLGREPSPEEICRARTLFARAIETPGGFKVQTIHAFAERLLQRFPLEAGVTPGFTIIDDVVARQLMREATDDMLSEATDTPNKPLGGALRSTIAFAADESFDELLRAALAKKDWIERIVRIYGDDGRGNLRDPFTAAAPFYRQAFSIGPGETQGSIDDERALILTPHAAEHAAQVLCASDKPTDNRLGQALAQAARSASDAERIACFAEALLTKEGNPRSDKQFVTKGVRETELGLTDQLCSARDRFAELTAKHRALDAIDATLALMRLADAVLTRYARLKARRAALDFEDLIRHTASLLRVSGSAEWVLYKLDGGLDHILVDESQDTSPEQWRIVEALAAEFFAGAGARAPDARDTSGDARPQQRTLFAVGDEKQSIYSFQGARPEEFARMGTAFRKRAEAARVAWENIPLTLSFRTVAPVLEAVDRVFADHRNTPGLAANASRTAGANPVATPVVHAAHRIGHAGLVEVWDVEKAAEAQGHDPWAPAETDGFDDTPPAVRLANRIAERIEQMVVNGEELLSEGRPITPGDILILVRKRHPFARPMVAALKARRIPVAGADRLSLADQTAVQDLIALADFLTLPEDDMALANVLKSPLFGFDDDQLLAIAHGRSGTLWKALLQRRSDSSAFEEAAELLREWRRRADFLPPFEFLAGVLDRDGMRRRLLARLGPEAADSIDELLNLAIAFDDSAPPSLTGFLTWLRESNREIKRDMEHGRDEVRVMTVHGAKGLEAPVVFLPDTCSTSSVGRSASLYPLATPPAPKDTPPAFVWQIKGAGQLPPIAAGREAVKERDREERNRLLYVAMTRARDRLYVAGFDGKQKRSPESWYDLVRNGLDGLLKPFEDDSGRSVFRFESRQMVEAKTPDSKLTQAHPAVLLEEWATSAAPREPQLTMPLAPSRLAPYDVDDAGEPVAPPPTARTQADEPPATRPAARTAGNRFLRGTLTHALLKHLPDFPADAWEQAAAAFVATRGRELPPAVRNSIVRETLAVLTSSEFAPLFGPQSRAEVAIAAEIPRPDGRGPALKLNGQIDRLAVHADVVYIIDYKTNRPPPNEASQVADAYVLQLAAYRLALAQMFPQKLLRAAILWTDGPRLLEISDTMLATYERRLWDLDATNLDVP